MPDPTDPASAPSTGKRGRGRSPRISRDQIVTAALEVGFDQLTMKAVAAHLGVTHTALYHHIDDRDDLMKAAIRTVFAGVGLADAPSWREYLAGVVGEIVAILDRYPGLAGRVIQHLAVHPVLMQFSRIAVTLVDRYAFTPVEAIFAVDLLHDFTDVPMLFEVSFNAPVATPEGTVPMRAVGMAPWVRTLDPRLQPAMTGVLAGDPGRWFEVKLGALLDGIAQGRERIRAWDVP